MGDFFQYRMSGILYRTERPPGSPFQSKGLDGTPRPGGVQKLWATPTPTYPCTPS